MDIKHIRELTGLTQSNFAEKYHIPLDTLKGWEAMSYSSRYRECPEYVKYMLLRLVAIDYDYELEKIMERGNKRMSNEYVDLVDILLKKNLRSVFLKKQRNNNVLLIGQSGTGKKSCYIIPSIMQCCNSSSSPSIIVNDLNGSIYDATKEHLEKQGYDLQVVDLSFKNNRLLQFNPFSYMEEETYEKDIYDIVSCFSEKYVKETYEPYWDDASRKVLNILFNAIYQETGFKTDIPSIARECLTVGDDIVYNYDGEFKIARNTIESAMIQARLLLYPFADGCFRTENEAELNSITSKKTAIFLTCNELPTEQTGIMLRIFYTTLFKQLEQICFKENSIPVRIYMDDLSVMGILDRKSVV